MKTLAYVVTTAIVVHLTTVYVITKQAQEETKPEFASTLEMCNLIYGKETKERYGELTKEIQAELISRMRTNSTADEWKDFNKHCLTQHIQQPTK
ncbi:hypothetical protein [Nostoc cycadae]|uniref:Exosortase n=1 Tax=Nostoc cycadae WK-1 TaxID=1861711 RepID=A0A2H6LCB1_9NOSO|nr:hypothetical protein [Nostoc cycadae]GBE90832.1 exosortase [Nostoc cycadae WK-1]